MSVRAQLIGTDDKGRIISAKVNASGELVVSDGPYDLVEFRELAVDNAPYNFYGPIVGKQFVVTGLLSFADKQVNTSTNATVTIYEASAPDTATEDKVILKYEMGQNQQLPFPNVRILVNPGVWLNAKTDDDDIHMNIIGHYIATVQDPVQGSS